MATAAPVERAEWNVEPRWMWWSRDGEKTPRIGVAREQELGVVSPCDRDAPISIRSARPWGSWTGFDGEASFFDPAVDVVLTHYCEKR